MVAVRVLNIESEIDGEEEKKGDVDGLRDSTERDGDVDARGERESEPLPDKEADCVVK